MSNQGHGISSGCSLNIVALGPVIIYCDQLSHMVSTFIMIFDFYSLRGLSPSHKIIKTSGLKRVCPKHSTYYLSPQISVQILAT